MGDSHRPIRPSAVDVQHNPEREAFPIKITPRTLLSPEEARALANNLDRVLRENYGLSGEDEGQ